MNNNISFADAIIDTVCSLVIVLDKHGGIVLFNKACEQMTGYKTAEVLGRRFWDFLLIPEERDAVKAVFQDLFQGHFPNNHENYWLTKDGRLRWVAWSNTAIVDENGDVDYVIGTGVDNTERRQVEIELRRSEQQFRLLAENISEMFWLASPDRKVMYYVSPAFEKIWGRPCADIYANPMVFLESSPEEDRSRILADHAAQHKGRFKDYYELEFRIHRPDGEMRWIASHYVPVLDENGKVFRVAGVSTDITERKQAEEERLRHERNQRDTLVREVHHRIKNNLQGVIGLLRQHASRNPELGACVQSAITQVSSMALVHGLQSKDPGERVMMCDMCDAIAASIMGTTGAVNRIHVIRRSPKPFAIAVDEAVPLALIMNELIFNAVKHSPAEDNTPITVTIDACSDGVIVRIRNCGTRLPKSLNVMDKTGLGTGLTLVRTLLPKSASVNLRMHGDCVETELRAGAPVVELCDRMSSSTAVHV